MAEKSFPVKVDKLSGPRAAGVIRLEVGNFFPLLEWSEIKLVGTIFFDWKPLDIWKI